MFWKDGKEKQGKGLERVTNGCRDSVVAAASTGWNPPFKGGEVGKDMMAIAW